MRLFLLFCLLLTVSELLSQDHLLLMNGQDIEGRILDDSSTVMIVELTRKNGKTRQKEVHKSDVFSYTKQDGREIVLYSYDTLFGDVYRVDEMRIYLVGQRDARENFSALPTAAVGFVLCGTIAYLGQDGLLTAMAPPLAYTLFQLAPKIKIREKYMSDLNYKYNDIYAEGFEPPARSRKLMSGMAGGFSGSAIGVLLFFLFQ